MNGCDLTLFLIRWRAINESATVRASWQHSGAQPGEFTGDERIAATGWMVLDGCQVPQFTLAAAGELTLADVAVSTQQYNPMP